MTETEIDWAAIAGSEWYKPDRVIPAFAEVRKASNTASNAMLFAVGNNHAGELYPAAFHAVPILLDIAANDPSQTVRATALAILDDMMWFTPGLAPLDTVKVDGVDTQIDVAIRSLVAAALPMLKRQAGQTKLIGSLAETLAAHDG